ncbi:MAG: threonine/serine exporter family protein [Flavobacteriales bacterium]|nr:MAG: threonine/serine exporter family protein [Flavobacteriales bacterium]
MSTTDRTTLLRFLSRLGQAELAAGNAVALIERDLGQIAHRNGVHDLTASVLPTVMFLQLEDGTEHRLQLTLGPYRSGGLRFDQIEGVLTVARDARSGRITPSEGLRRLDAIWKMKHRYRDVGFVFGYLITTIGVGLMIRPTWQALSAVSVLGLVCALLLVMVRRQPSWSAVMPVVAAFVLSSAVALAYRMGFEQPVMDLLIPPLIVFLPGSMLTVAIVELAFANVVSGATRLVAGFAQLILLAFGILGGFHAFGGLPTVTHLPVDERLALWMPWLGVLLFAVGLHLYKSSRARSLVWMIATMLMAYLGQTLSDLVLDGASTAFFGAVLMTVSALTIEYRFNGPPALITFLPAFWLLAPGSLGLESVTSITTTGTGTAMNILQFLFTLTAIATGCLIGAFIYSGVFHFRRVRWFGREHMPASTTEPAPDNFPERLD